MEFGAGRPARCAGRFRESSSGGALRAEDGALAFGAFRMWGLPVPAPALAQTLSGSREGNYELPRLTTTCFTGAYRGRVLDWSSRGGR